jgi:hypothetical protein
MPGTAISTVNVTNAKKKSADGTWSYINDLYFVNPLCSPDRYHQQWVYQPYGDFEIWTDPLN